MMKNLNKQLVLFILMVSVNYSCKEFLEIEVPKDAASPIEMFSNDAIATSAITGIYSRMANLSAYSGGASSFSVLRCLSADELIHINQQNVFYKNEIPASDFEVTRLWAESYSYIYTSNAILEKLQSANGVTENVSKQLQGEAKFIRAFCYFNLVNIFGDVPLNLTTDYRINQVAQRSSTENIYRQIIADLKDAENLLPINYLSNERIRPNKWVAKSLLSRVYLYNKNWNLAVQKATEVIDQNSTYELIQDLDQVFVKNSKEAIWQIMPTAGSNTKEGSLFILNATPTSVYLSPDFVLLFETDDNRKIKWINQFTNTTGKYYYPYKYKIRTTLNGVVNEYSMVIRLAELHLIRAEARAQLSQADLSLEDINLIRKRAGIITPFQGLNSNQCLDEIARQRKFELFSEWGHRWLDLKRTDRVTASLAPIKGITWQDTDVLYPIPLDELSRNPNLIQNLGY